MSNWLVDLSAEDDVDLEIPDEPHTPKPNYSMFQPLSATSAASARASTGSKKARVNPALPSAYSLAACKSALDSEVTDVSVLGRHVLLCENEVAAIDKQMKELINRRAQTESVLMQLKDRVSVLSHENAANENAMAARGAERAGPLRWSDDFKWNADLERARKDVFGIRSWRHNQKEVINATIAGRDSFVLMPTGGGKSLLYQLPAVLDSKTFTLVISPLLSLSHDQLHNLAAVGVRGEMLHANTPKEIVNQIYLDMCDPQSTMRLLYVTPEKIVKSKMFLSKLEKAHDLHRIGRIAIDEAHCCSAWGHDFRPDYKQLNVLKNRFPDVPIIALTATATQQVIEDVQKILRIERSIIFKSPFNRPNLNYSVRIKKDQAKAVLTDIANLIETEYHNATGIIYCFSKKECETVAEFMSASGIKSSAYHADMTPQQRERAHKAWYKGSIKVVVATVAFGMGINKPDVRFVIHHSMAKSIEGYYQESGRAGRDGLPADCIVFYRPGDYVRQAQAVDLHHQNQLQEMAWYCSRLDECRRVTLYRYFSEPFHQRECHQHCDICRGVFTVQTQECGPVAAALSNTLQQLRGRDNGNPVRVTINQLIDAFWKAEAAKFKFSKDDLMRILVECILTQKLQFEFRSTAFATNAYLTFGLHQASIRGADCKFPVKFDSSRSSSGGSAAKSSVSKAAKPQSSRKGKKEAEPEIQDEDDECGFPDEVAEFDDIDDVDQFQDHELYDEGDVQPAMQDEQELESIDFDADDVNDDDSDVPLSSKYRVSSAKRKRIAAADEDDDEEFEMGDDDDELHRAITASKLESKRLEAKRLETKRVEAKPIIPSEPQAMTFAQLSVREKELHRRLTLRLQEMSTHFDLSTHSIASSEHLIQLAHQKPDSLVSIGEIMGKTRQEKYGELFLDVILTFLSADSYHPMAFGDSSDRVESLTAQASLSHVASNPFSIPPVASAPARQLASPPSWSRLSLSAHKATKSETGSDSALNLPTRPLLQVPISNSFASSSTPQSSSQASAFQNMPVFDSEDDGDDVFALTKKKH